MSPATNRPSLLSNDYKGAPFLSIYTLMYAPSQCSRQTGAGARSLLCSSKETGTHINLLSRPVWRTQECGVCLIGGDNKISVTQEWSHRLQRLRADRKTFVRVYRSRCLNFRLKQSGCGRTVWSFTFFFHFFSTCLRQELPQCLSCKADVGQIGDLRLGRQIP